MCTLSVNEHEFVPTRFCEKYDTVGGLRPEPFDLRTVYPEDLAEADLVTMYIIEGETPLSLVSWLETILTLPAYRRARNAEQHAAQTLADYTRSNGAPAVSALQRLAHAFIEPMHAKRRARLLQIAQCAARKLPVPPVA